MSRIAKKPISVPQNVKVEISGKKISMQGPKGKNCYEIHPYVSVALNDNNLVVSECEKTFKKLPRKEQTSRLAKSIAGTMRSLINNMVIGVANGFEKKLQLVGVGYRAQVQGNLLNLTLGFSHPVQYPIPEGITIEVPEQTVIVVKGIDKQLVGAVSADIRRYRPPEPYKGKGIRLSTEVIKRKETKKK